MHTKARFIVKASLALSKVLFGDPWRTRHDIKAVTRVISQEYDFPTQGTTCRLYGRYFVVATDYGATYIGKTMRHRGTLLRMLLVKLGIKVGEVQEIQVVARQDFHEAVVMTLGTDAANMLVSAPQPETPFSKVEELQHAAYTAIIMQLASEVGHDGEALVFNPEGCVRVADYRPKLTMFGAHEASHMGD